MMRLVARRLGAGVVLLLTLTTMTFFLLHLAAGDVARTILGATASQEAVEQRARELGLDRPLSTQFTDWVAGAVRGDLGTSWFTSQPVTEAITSRLGVTLSMVLGATVLAALVSVVLGVLAATRGGWLDRTVQILVVLGFAVPGFILAIVLVNVFALRLGWFQPTGYVGFTDSLPQWLSSITLPVLALAAGGVAALVQQVRGSVKDALSQDYVRTLRSRGLPEHRVVYRHIMRNAAGPALSVLAVQFISLISGAIFIEQIFAIPGLGQVAVSSTAAGDIPMVMGLVVVVAVLVVVLNLAADLVQAWLNPKVREA